MLAKIVIAVIVALVTMVIFRQFSERDKRARVQIKNHKPGAKQPKNLVWDEKTQSYRSED